MEGVKNFHETRNAALKSEFPSSWKAQSLLESLVWHPLYHRNKQTSRSVVTAQVQRQKKNPITFGRGDRKKGEENMRERIHPQKN